MHVLDPSNLVYSTKEENKPVLFPTRTSSFESGLLYERNKQNNLFFFPQCRVYVPKAYNQELHTHTKQTSVVIRFHIQTTTLDGIMRARSSTGAVRTKDSCAAPHSWVSAHQAHICCAVTCTPQHRTSISVHKPLRDFMDDSSTRQASTGCV
jgi:hypothetical protein